LSDNKKGEGGETGGVAAERKHLYAMTFITDITAEAENDRHKTHLGSWEDD
jgi:hypothetical protein